MTSGSAGPARLADALAKYWSAAIEPHWPAMRTVLDDDVAFRAGQLTRGGIGAMLTGLHPQVSVSDEMLYIAKNATSEKKDLSGQGLLLVPSVFVWPNVVVAVGAGGPPSVSPSTVSEHLSVLRRCGLVMSWRAGRRVLYRRTDLADSLVETANGSLIASA